VGWTASVHKGYERPAQSRAAETNYDIAVILKEYSVKLPTRKTTGFGDSYKQFTLYLFTLLVDRTSYFCTYTEKDLFQPLVQSQAIAR
jgi:hypothetical protein